TTNWGANRYENILYIYFRETEESRQLTQLGSVQSFEWLNNDDLIAQRLDDDSSQLYLYEGLTGEPIQLTWIETGVDSFKPTKNGFLFQAKNPERSKRKQLRNQYGNVTHFEEEDPVSSLYYSKVAEVKKYHNLKKQFTEEEANNIVEPIIEVSKSLGVEYQIDEYQAVSDGVYVVCRPKDYLVYWNRYTSHKITLDLDAALSKHLEGLEWMGEAKTFNLPGASAVVGVSPDETMLLVEHKERDDRYYTQADLWTLEVDKIDEEQLVPYLKKITGKVDERCGFLRWTPDGVYVVYAKGTVTGVALVGLSGEVVEYDFAGAYPDLTVNVNESGYMAYIGNNNDSFPDVYVSKLPARAALIPEKITDYNAQVQSWDMGTVETIQWKSRDGATIEGVLRKPSDYDPSKKYPLLFQVHGGPASFSKEWLLEAYDYQRYPCVQLVNSGVLVLKPNYRGSIGYGQAFLELNKDNLGVGDLWDLESAIETLVEQGIVDPTQVGSMGWSQGGYISAYAGLRSNKFKAVSVGAGVSDWYTYHISNDIPQFTDHYLSANPWENREIYEKTAPITGIKTAHTPMLIQHGGKDQRVPLSNGMELYRALKAKGVPVELFVYP
ncbi:S9 family peptidase, partial [Candidatus Bathyarchaeota archaeon]